MWPSGLAIHSTATLGATDEAEQKYFEDNYVGASAHYFVDWDSITRTIPEDEVAWHAGPTANRTMLSIELCEPGSHDPAKFTQVWKRGVWLAADICRRRGISSKLVFSHALISAAWHETAHQDPNAYFAAYGKTFNDFINDVAKELTPTPEEVDMNFALVPEQNFSSEHEFGGLTANPGESVWVNLRAKASAPAVVDGTLFRESGKAVTFTVDLNDEHPVAVPLSDKVTGSFSAKFKSGGPMFYAAVTQYRP